MTRIGFPIHRAKALLQQHIGIKKAPLEMLI